MLHPYTIAMFEHMGIAKEDIPTLNEPQSMPLDDVFYKALDLIDQAIQNKQKIFVAGDFDADGICATSLLVRLLKQKKADVGYYIPDRLKEGYGLSCAIAQSAIDKGYDLFIMVDNGVSLFEVHDLLKQHNKQSIILDHHTLTKKVEVDVLIHPDHLSDYYDRLCGAGLSYCLAQAAGLDDDVSLQLTTVATIGDMMPLVGFNRHLVRAGLKVLNNHPMVHFSNLVKKQAMDEEDIAYFIVPKLNAVGRLSDVANVNNVVSFLLSEETSQILGFIESLESINNTRKKMVKSMQVLAQDYLNDDEFNFVVDESFHQGVVGILAGQLANQTKKPTLVATIDQGMIKGSLRSHDVNLHALLSDVSEHLDHFGGHANAAGISLARSEYEAFKAKVLERYTQFKQAEKEKVTLCVDPSIIEMSGIKQFESYRPFGMEFERPLLQFDHVKVIKTQHLSKHNLSKWVLDINNTPVEAITFDDVDQQTQAAASLCVIGTLAYKPYNGYDKVVMRIEKVTPYDFISE